MMGLGINFHLFESFCILQPFLDKFKKFKKFKNILLFKHKSSHLTYTILKSHLET